MTWKQLLRLNFKAETTFFLPKFIKISPHYVVASKGFRATLRPFDPSLFAFFATQKPVDIQVLHARNHGRRSVATKKGLMLWQRETNVLPSLGSSHFSTCKTVRFASADSAPSQRGSWCLSKKCPSTLQIHSRINKSGTWSIAIMATSYPWNQSLQTSFRGSSVNSRNFLNNVINT